MLCRWSWVQAHDRIAVELADAAQPALEGPTLLLGATRDQILDLPLRQLLGRTATGQFGGLLHNLTVVVVHRLGFPNQSSQRGPSALCRTGLPVHAMSRF